jgi:cytochrome c553
MPKFIVCLLVGLSLLLTLSSSFAKENADAVASCVGCHGDKGNSMAPIFPKLAGQNSKYLAKQLEDFRSHKRKNPTMEGLAASLSDENITTIAAYYAAQTIQAPIPFDEDEDEDDEEPNQSNLSSAQEALLTKGKRLYQVGDLQAKIPACNACHGPNGLGNALAGFPALKNQHSTYLASSLKQYREAIRSNDGSNMMRMTARRMSNQDIDAVAAYLASL